MSIRTVIQLMKYAFNAKITKCHRYNPWKNSIMVSRMAYCMYCVYIMEANSNSSITKFEIQDYWCLQAYIKNHRITGKKPSVLQNSLLQCMKKKIIQNFMRLSHLSYVCKQLCLMERRIKGLLVESMTKKKDTYFEQKIHHNSLTLVD